MKKKAIFIGSILLIIISCLVINNQINKEYNDYNTIKVKDGELLILKRNNCYSIVEIVNQTTNPEKANYNWCQVDGSLTILDKNPTLFTRSGITGDGLEKGKLTPIEFDDFKFYWSAHTEGEGFIYLNYFPKNNEKQGAFYWAQIPKTDLTESIILNAESKFQLMDIKKENLIIWMWKRLKIENN